MGIFQITAETDSLRIEIISKTTEPHILCGDIQFQTEKDSSVLK